MPKKRLRTRLSHYKGCSTHAKDRTRDMAAVASDFEMKDAQTSFKSEEWQHFGFPVSKNENDEKILQDVQQLLETKDEIKSEQQGWSSSLEQEGHSEPPDIKKEQEELWTSQDGEHLQEEADNTHTCKVQDLKDSFKLCLLTAAREELMEHFEMMILMYEKELHRQQKLMDVVLRPEITLQRTDLQLLLNTKEEVKTELQDTNHSLVHVDLPEPPHITEEKEELWTSQEGHHLQKEIEKTNMSRCQDLKSSFKWCLLTEAREDLMELFEKMILEYEKEIHRQQKLLDVVLKPDVKMQRAVCPADSQQQLVSEQYWSPYLDQENPPGPLHIKEEKEELGTSQEGEQLPEHEEFTLVALKTEDYEKNPQLSNLHQPHQMNTEDCWRPEPTRNPDLDRQSDSDDKTEDSSEPVDFDKDWRDPDRKSFACSVCGKTFKHSRQRNLHIRTHAGVKSFSCSLCGKTFTQRAGLQCHLKIHTGERPFSCSVCSKTYRHRGALSYHMTTHTGVKPFSCMDCGKRFKVPSQLKIHKCINEFGRGQSDETKKTLTCSECNVTFPNNYLLKTHIRMHKGKKLYICTICGTTRQYSSHLEIHMRTHTGERPYSCPTCGKRFSQRGIMKQHMAIHSGVKPYSCSVCGKRFFWPFQIKRHKCLGGSTQETRFSSGDSDPLWIFKSLRGLNQDKGAKFSIEKDKSVDFEFWKETRQHHSGLTYRRDKKVNNGHNMRKKIIGCSADNAKTQPKNDKINIDFCQQKRQRNLNIEGLGDTAFNTVKPYSSSEHTLQTHKKYYTGSTPFICLFCEKAFATGGYLTRHLSVHLGEKLPSCVVCEKTFSSKSELMSHKCTDESSQLHHSQNAEQFSCSNCDKVFRRKHHLQVHMRTHAGEKPFSCSVCGKAFARREGLSIHMTCHTGGKPLHCSVCNMGFIDSESLIKHMRIHTRQTQFSCPICDKEFAWRRYLTKHMEVHNKEKLYKCDICDRGFNQVYQLNFHECSGLESRAEGNRKAPKLAELARRLEPDGCLKPNSPESKTKVGDDVLKGTRELKSDLNPMKNQETCLTFDSSSNIRDHSEEKVFDGSVSADGLKEGLDQCTAVHLGVQKDVAQEDPQLPHLVEEHEEMLGSREREHLKWLQEVKFTSVDLKTEDDETKFHSLQLHQKQREQIKIVKENCGAPELARSPYPDVPPGSDDSVDSDFWKETRERPTHLNSLKEEEITENLMVYDSGSKVSGCSDEKTSESLEPESDDSTNSNMWKDDRIPQEICKKPHNCSECGKRFLQIHHLKNHLKFHARQKTPFSCSVCGHECLYKSLLKIHMRTHTGEKPFPCPVCGKKYAHKASMQSHMGIHTVEKQYSCSSCDQSFAWYTELKYHQCAGKSRHEGETM